MKKPAFLGGELAFPTGPPGWPLSDETVERAVAQALSDGSWGKYHGPCHARLQRLLAEMHQLEFVTLCCSGTVGVELALRGMSVSPGDEVILAGYDFPGNFRAIEAIGALPVLVDIDPHTWSLDLKSADGAVTSRTRAVVVSHLHGGTALVPEIGEWATGHGLSVLEDVCQAPLASVGGQLAGTWGNAAVLSFGGSKLLTAGRGGAVLTNQAEIHQRMKVYAERGNQAFPLSELQAAVLPPQLEKLEERNRIRAINVARLLHNLTGIRSLCPVRTSHPEDRAAYYKLAWRVQQNEAGGKLNRDNLIAALKAEGIAIDSGFRGFTKRSVRRCRQVNDLSYSSQAADTTVLLHHPILLANETTIDRVSETIQSVVDALS